MKKLIMFLFVLISFTVSAQTVFYYGNDSVSAKEFLRAYQKNNIVKKNEKALRDYLDLFIASKLKVKEAKNRGYDTLSQIASDLDNLRQQILPNYLNDKEAVDRLVAEALLRSKKDIHLAHIFISAAHDADFIAKRVDSLQTELRLNHNFSTLAAKYSDDPAAGSNGGDLGWITAFSLPYELENLAYNTPVGKTSAVLTTRAGLHLFKNLGERNDPGRIQASQILLAFPPDASPVEKAAVKKLADSVYNRLIKGDNFAKLATQFSNDVVSAAANGQMPEFGIGQYDAAFESAAYALPANGAISKPVLTSYGYHIIKRNARILTPARNETLRERVEQSDRSRSTRAGLATKVLSRVGYKRSAVSNSTQFIEYSDSILSLKPIGRPLSITASTVVLELGKSKYDMTEWINYAQAFRYKSDGTGAKPYPLLWSEFVEAKALSYYEDHLEEFNDEFKQQLAEFREGNLFFEIMQRDIWTPAQTDSIELLNYYTAHKNNYTWNRSADAVIFYATDVASANTFSAELKKSPANWHSLVTNFSEKIAADSSRFEMAQLPNPSKLSLKAGTITSPLINGSDNTASLAYILHVYDQPSTRSFTEAKGMVINDYQNQLEQRWLADLKKKYPVHINEAVVRQLINVR